MKLDQEDRDAVYRFYTSSFSLTMARAGTGMEALLDLVDEIAPVHEVDGLDSVFRVAVALGSEHTGRGAEDDPRDTPFLRKPLDLLADIENLLSISIDSVAVTPDPAS